MGWLKGLKKPLYDNHGAATTTTTAVATTTDLIEHSLAMEDNNTTGASPKRKYAFHPLDTPTESLPFIPPDEVLAKSSTSTSSSSHSIPSPTTPDQLSDDRKITDLWIVIDSVVYDCSSFVYTHPGGEEVIRSFQGRDCSWQFWRFHGRQQLMSDGWSLRVGRTKTDGDGARVTNPFPVERPRFVGLRKLGDGGDDDDEW